jgi:hypothetical protein
MKVYGTDQYFAKDAVTGNRQARAVVAAPSKKRAAELLGLSTYMFNNYASETWNEEDLKLALAEPEKVIVRRIY